MRPRVDSWLVAVESGWWVEKPKETQREILEERFRLAEQVLLLLVLLDILERF